MNLGCSYLIITVSDLNKLGQFPTVPIFSIGPGLPTYVLPLKNRYCAKLDLVLRALSEADALTISPGF